MKRVFLSAIAVIGCAVAAVAAPTDAVTQADLQALLTRLNQLEAENRAQAEKIRRLESAQSAALSRLDDIGRQTAAQERKSAFGDDKVAKTSLSAFGLADGTTTNATGRVYTTGNGKKYYLADASARIFEPLSESGLQITPYGYLVLEGIYSDHALDCDFATDFVLPRSPHGVSTLSMQDSILGIQFMTPESLAGWKFSGKAEFDLAGSHENNYAFHWRHLYVNAAHESGWSVLFGQTWHLWKIVSPSEIDGAWMENTGHPYRRSPQIRVTKRWDWQTSSFEARAGILKGGPGMGGDRDSDLIEDNTGTAWVLFEGAAVYDHDLPWQNKADRLQTPRGLVGLGGMYGRDRSHRYNGVDYGGDGDDYDSMMALVAAKIPIWRFTLQGQIFAGENLGGVQAGCAQTVLYHNWESGYVRGNGVRTVGGFADLAYQLTEKWRFAIGFGFDNPVDSDVEGGINEKTYGILYNDRAYIDAFYQVTSNFRLGLEYARLLTSYADGNCYGGDAGDYCANRVQFSAYFDF